MEKVKIAIIPVAGYGTRFLPYTKAIPKPMLPIVNRPAIEIIAEEAASSGIDELVFVVGHKREIIESHFSACPSLEKLLAESGKLDYLDKIKYPESIAKIHFVVQEKRQGTAHAVLAASEFIKDRPFAVLFGDDVMYSEGRPVLKQLIDCFDKKGKTVIGVKKVPHGDVVKYASVEYGFNEGREYEVTKITEKPPLEKVKSDLAPLGRYVLAPSMLDILRSLKPSKNGEYQLTDALDIDARGNGAIAYEFDGVRYDMGDRLGFLKANIEFALRDEALSGALKEYLKSLVSGLD